MIWNLLVKISLCLDLYFWSYEGLKCMSRLMSQLMALWAEWHEKIPMARWIFGLARPVSRLMSRPTRHESTHESTSADLSRKIQKSDLLVCCNRSRLMSRLLKHESTHESTPATGNVSNGYFFARFNCHLCFLKIL